MCNASPLQTKLSLASQGYEKLVAHLVKPATDEMGRVRALFIWLTSQDRDTVLDFYVQQKTKKQSSLGEDIESPLPCLYEFFVNKNPDRLAEAFQILCRLV